MVGSCCSRRHRPRFRAVAETPKPCRPSRLPAFVIVGEAEETVRVAAPERRARHRVEIAVLGALFDERPLLGAHRRLGVRAPRETVPAPEETCDPLENHESNLSGCRAADIGDPHDSLRRTRTTPPLSTATGSAHSSQWFTELSDALAHSLDNPGGMAFAEDLGIQASLAVALTHSIPIDVVVDLLVVAVLALAYSMACRTAGAARTAMRGATHSLRAVAQVPPC
jgi:hypothetical protein